MKLIYSCTAAVLMILAGAALFRPHVVNAGPGSTTTANATPAPAAVAGQKMHWAENYGKMPLGFEANQGQTDSRVKFLSHGRGYSLFLTRDEAVLTFGRTSQMAKGKGQKAKVKAGAVPTFGSTTADVAQHTLFGAEALPHVLSFSKEAASPVAPRAKGASLPDLLSLSGPNEESESQVEKPRDRSAGPALPFSRLADRGDSSTVLRMRLVGANASASVTGADELPGKSNYFIGNDPKKWRTNVPNYAKVKYQNVYPGVDLVYYGNQSGQLEYDFVVAPGADPRAIVLDIGAGLPRHRNVGAGLVPARKGHPRGVPLRIVPNGDLVVKADGGEVRFHKPVVYQEQSTVDNSQSTVQSEKLSATGNPKSKIGNSLTATTSCKPTTELDSKSLLMTTLGHSSLTRCWFIPRI